LQIGNGGTTGSLGTGSVTDNAALNVDLGNAYNVTNAISGTGTLTQAGSGTTTLSSANTYSGDTTISSGTLQYGVANAIASGAGNGNIIDNGTLDVNGYNAAINGLSGSGVVDNISAGGTPTLTIGNNNATSGFSGVIQDTTGTLGITKTGSGTFTLSGTNTYDGTTTISAGTVVANNTQALGASTAPLNMNGGTLDIQTNSSITPYNTTVSANSTIEADLAAAGAGITQTLGTLSIGTATLNLAVGSNVTSGTAGLTFGTTTVTGNPAFTAATGSLLTLGALNDGGTPSTLAFNGAGVTTLATAATSLVNGTQVNISGNGTLNSDNATALGTLAAVDVASGSTLGVGTSQTLGALTDSGNVVINGANTLTVGSTNNLSSTFSGVISGSTGALTTGGTGTFTLSGANTYGGATMLNAGSTLQYGAANAIPNGASAGSVTDNGTLDVNGYSSTINNLSGSGVVDNVTAGGTPVLTVAANTSSTTFSGVIQNTTGNLSLAITGTTGSLTLTGANTYAGTTTISGGTLQIGNGGTTGSSGTGSVTDNANLTYDLSNNPVVSGGISGSGSLTQAGSGTLILTGSNSYGSTTISAGILQVGNGGASGSLGTGAVTDNSALNYNLSNSATLSNTITGTGSLTQSGGGTLIVSGNSNFSGGTTLAAGTLSAGNNNALGTGVVTMDTGTLTENTSGITLPNNISLAGSSIIDNNSGTFTLDGTINGANALTLNGSGTTVLNGHVGNTAALVSVAGNTNLTVNGGGVATSGNQIYNDAVAIDSTSVFSTSGTGTEAITFNNNITGGHDVTLSGTSTGTYDFSMNNITAHNVDVTAAAGSTNNLLTLNTGGIQNFTINGSNTGKVTGITTVTGTFDFNTIQNLTGDNFANNFIVTTGTLSGTMNGSGGVNSLTTNNNLANNWNITGVNSGNITSVVGAFVNIQTLTGGTGVNTFNFSPGAMITGTLNGGSIAAINDINFSAYNTVLNLVLNPPVGNIISSGIVYDNNGQSIVDFSQVLKSSGDNIGYLTVPSNVPNLTVKYYDSTKLNGEIDDPFIFLGWIIGNPPPPPPPTPPTPVVPADNASPTLYIAPIVNQPVTNSNNNNNYSQTFSNYGNNNTDVNYLNLTSVLPLLETTQLSVGSTCYAKSN
jgi:autotransporter-associated beta strand protein